ncbi:universal stress protein [Streptomyces sp. NBC_01304]|uniref:universal stress protein n=1 Tax=Streptomyces sp. NBC_01304 TaxID=2903818 RepID=UPI002E0E615E|nr:universal stress protein [Streptomyces sp. NBC_01304]
MSSNAPVLVAVDGSQHSLDALRWALDEAVLRDAEVLALHVSAAADGDPVAARIAEVLAGRDRAPQVSYETVDGTPAAVLAERAAKAQLLVLGSRGLGGFAALLLGSTGRKCAANAPCPVVVVPHATRTAEAPVPEGGHGRVALGLSPQETSDEAIEFAFAEAERRGAELQVISTYLVPLTSLTRVGELVDAPDTDQARVVEAAQSARLAPFAERHPAVAVVPVVTAGDPAGRLVTGSRTADLTVVGRHRRRLRPDALVMGSVTNAVLQHAQGSVAVVPGAE